MKLTRRKRLRIGMVAALAVAVHAGLTHVASAQEAKKDQPSPTASKATAQEPAKPQPAAQQPPSLSSFELQPASSQPGEAGPSHAASESTSRKEPGKGMQAEGPVNRPVIPAPTPTVQLKPGEVPAIEFDTPTYDFGRVKAGEPIEHEFWFTNKGTGPLEILSAKAG